jgi:hypothetical protein
MLLIVNAQKIIYEHIKKIAESHQQQLQQEAVPHNDFNFNNELLDK